MPSSSVSNLWGEGSSESVSGLLQLYRDNNKPAIHSLVLPFPQAPTIRTNWGAFMWRFIGARFLLPPKWTASFSLILRKKYVVLFWKWVLAHSCWIGMTRMLPPGHQSKLPCLVLRGAIYQQAWSVHRMNARAAPAVNLHVRSLKKKTAKTKRKKQTLLQIRRTKLRKSRRTWVGLC